ncbi:MAG: hypothetical protein VX090_15200, partial [Pseudomonadota bacterium]|nr:hypothetical protein [Pseudomonadota bacterium]
HCTNTRLGRRRYFSFFFCHYGPISIKNLSSKKIAKTRKADHDAFIFMWRASIFFSASSKILTNPVAL